MLVGCGDANIVLEQIPGFGGAPSVLKSTQGLME